MTYIHIALIVSLVLINISLVVKSLRKPQAQSWKVRHSQRVWGQLTGDYAPVRYRIDRNPDFAGGATTLQLHRTDLGLEVTDKSPWLSVGFIQPGSETELVGLNIFRRYREGHELTETLSVLKAGLAKGTISMVVTEKAV